MTRRFDFVRLGVSAALVLALALHLSPASAVNYFSRATANWTANGAWSTVACGGASAGNADPGGGAGDTATICNGNTITLNTTPANALATLTVNLGGTLAIGSNTTARTLNVTGNASNAGTIQYATNAAHVISIGGTFTNSGTFTSAAVAGAKTLTVTGLITNSNAFQYAGTAALTVNANGGISNSGTFDVATASNVTHVLNVGGDITNTGTLNLATDANSLVNTTFNRNGNQTVSGAGATTQFNLITVNMGATVNNILDITATNFSINPSLATGFLTLTNGTFRFSTTGTITPYTVAPTLGTTQRFWLNNSGATVNSGNISWTLNGGGLQIDSGSMNMGTTATADLVLNNNASTSVVINGGSLTLTGSIRSSAAAAAGTYTQTGGTVIVATVSPTTNSSFFLGSATTFTMNSSSSASKLLIRNISNASAFDLCGTQNVTGGTIQFGDASYVGGAGFSFSVQDQCTGTAVNFWDLVLDSPSPAGANPPQVVLFSTAGTNILDDLTIAQTSGGNAVMSLNAANLPITIGGGNAAGHGNFTNNGTFCAGTYAGGACTLATSTVTFAGTATPGVGIGGTSATTFSTLAVNKTGGATLPINKSPTVNTQLTLTSGTATTSSNKITLAAAATVSPVRTTSSAGATNHVFGNVEKAYDATHLSFTYPVGDGTNFTPVTVTFTTLTTAGNLTATTASPATPAADHPDTTGGRSGIDFSKSVNRYFTLNNPTATGTYTVALNYLSTDNDGGASPATFVVARGETCATSTTNTGGRTCNPWGIFTPTTRTSSQAVVGGLLLVSGDRDADFAIGNQTTARFIRPKEFVYSRELY